MSALQRGELYYDVETLSDEELREEMIMTGLRTACGIDLNGYKNRWGADECNRLIDRARDNIKMGNLAIDTGFLRVTEQGVMILDEIIVELF